MANYFSGQGSIHGSRLATHVSFERMRDQSPQVDDIAQFKNRPGSLGRPGGNVTGLSSLAGELNTKRLEVIKDVIPKLARVGLLRPAAGGTIAIELQLKELRAAASGLKLKLEEIPTPTGAEGLENAFKIVAQKQVGAIMTTPGRRFIAEAKRIVELAGKYRLPAMYPQKEFVDEGGLMSYGADDPDLYRRAGQDLERR